MSSPFYASSNPFDEDDDYKYKKQNRNNDEKLSHEEQIQRMMEQIDDSERRQLDSTRRALAGIDESERVGVATAEVINFKTCFL